MQASGQLHALAVSLLGKMHSTQRRLVEPHSWSGRSGVEEILITLLGIKL
jgi:hypothetical protein